MQYRVCSVQYRVCSVQYRVCSVQYRVCSVQYRVCSVHYRVCSVQCLLPVSRPSAIRLSPHHCVACPRLVHRECTAQSHCTLHTVYCTLLTAHSTLYTAQYIFYTTLSKLHIAHNTMYSARITALQIVHSTLQYVSKENKIQDIEAEIKEHRAQRLEECSPGVLLTLSSLGSGRGTGEGESASCTKYWGTLK